MISLRKAAHCIGIAGPFSVIHDFFGFWGEGPRPLSLLVQLRRLQDKHVHLNVIATGLLTEPDHAFLDEGLQAARGILSAAAIGIGRVEYYAIVGDERFDSRRALAVDKNLLDELSDGWSVPNDGIDVFVPHEVVGSTNGRSPVGGSCDKSGKDSGLLVGASDRGWGPALGRTIAHELGHFFGLHHYAEFVPAGSLAIVSGSIRWRPDNLMHFSSDQNGDKLFPWQIWVMRRHCSMRDGCGM